jgi:hypothetical protein
VKVVVDLTDREVKAVLEYVAEAPDRATPDVDYGLDLWRVADRRFRAAVVEASRWLCPGPEGEPPRMHDWVDPSNAVVEGSGYGLCVNCGAFRPGVFS